MGEDEAWLELAQVVLLQGEDSEDDEFFFAAEHGNKNTTTALHIYLSSGDYSSSPSFSEITSTVVRPALPVRRRVVSSSASAPAGGEVVVKVHPLLYEFLALAAQKAGANKSEDGRPCGGGA